jgi:hypothetical protein
LIFQWFRKYDALVYVAPENRRPAVAVSIDVTAGRPLPGLQDGS